jgi:hypothetical protein
VPEGFLGHPGIFPPSLEVIAKVIGTTAPAALQQLYR